MTTGAKVGNLNIAQYANDAISYCFTCYTTLPDVEGRSMYFIYKGIACCLVNTLHLFLLTFFYSCIQNNILKFQTLNRLSKCDFEN